MQRVVIMLPQILGGIQFEEIVQRIIVAAAIIDVHSAGDIQRDGTVGFFEFMPQRQIGTVDIEPAGRAIVVPCRGAHGPAVLVYRG